MKRMFEGTGARMVQSEGGPKNTNAIGVVASKFQINVAKFEGEGVTNADGSPKSPTEVITVDAWFLPAIHGETGQTIWTEVTDPATIAQLNEQETATLDYDEEWISDADKP